eukprot:TRINITY_DN4950_c0_g1_i2.p1 TRINITY_DN4950_c0_g1~~TRINITY_DN4950_c0_g1_i2.p1  ORF type:complete len:546 (-),score=81.81 TRINITY_DN4950_c0_g1_i2:6-1643(-)
MDNEGEVELQDIRTISAATLDEEDGDGIDVEGGQADKDSQRVLSIWKFIGIGFFLTCGGAFGIELAVKAAGPGLFFLGLIILPIFFALPQAFITAELSSMMDENGGYILWIQRAFGNFAAWVNAYNAMAASLFDMAIYPVLFASYFQELLGGTSAITSSGSIAASASAGSESSIFVPFDPMLFVLKLIFVGFVMLLNIRGVEVVGVASFVLFAAILSPFVIELFVAFPKLEPALWVKGSEEAVNWPLLLATLLWNFTGFDRFGTFAGEVKDPKKTYSTGSIAVVFLTTISYIIPVAVGVSIIPNNTEWEDGTFVEIGFKLHKWLGVFLGIAALLSTLGNYNGSVMTASRALWAMGKQHSFGAHETVADQIPSKPETHLDLIKSGCGITPSEDEDFTIIHPIFGYTYEKFNTPLVAIIFYSVTTSILMSFKFEVLVEVTTFCQCVGLIFEFAAYIKLKYAEPDADRPYEVPGGMVGAWVVTISPLIFLFATIGSSFFVENLDEVVVQMGIFLGINVLIIVSYWARLYYKNFCADQSYRLMQGDTTQ